MLNTNFMTFFTSYSKAHESISHPHILSNMHVHITTLSKYNSRVWSFYLYVSLYAQFVLSVLPTLTSSSS